MAGTRMFFMVAGVRLLLLQQVWNMMSKQDCRIKPSAKELGSPAEVTLHPLPYAEFMQFTEGKCVTTRGALFDKNSWSR